nr:Lysophospholipase BODYGUARD 2 precursor [Ipomoea batatas]
MAAGTSMKLSAPSARSHTRNPKEKTSIMFLSSGLLRKVLAICCVGFLAWAYREITPPPPITCGSQYGPPVTAHRIKLSDGRHLAYKEHGVPRNRASYKIVFVHCFDCCRHDIAVAVTLSPNLIESLGIYIVSFDRPGYGESDPNPKQKEKSIAFDIQELADQLEIGSKFYVVGFSMGGQGVWSCLKYIPHSFMDIQVFVFINRLAGAVLLSPAVNYWWPGFPRNLSKQAYESQLPQDQWALRVSHYIPWLTYWWNTQKLFPALSYTAYEPSLLNPQDIEVMAKYLSAREKYQDQVNQQGDFESLHRDLIVGLGKWEFDPMDLENPFPNNEGSVHLWQGDEDGLVPVTLQRYIAQKLPWIHYHELPGAGHMFPYVDAMGDQIVKALLHT